MSLKHKDIAGQKFNKLTALRIVGYEEPYRSNEKPIPLWECLCDCGSETVGTVYNIVRGRKKSCGCLRKESTTKTHGMTKTKIYVVYRNMWKRCYNKNEWAYPYYGGRGIKLCDRWMEPEGIGFMNFYADMGDIPNGLEIERVNNDGDYCPDNCVWAARSEQTFNQRKRCNNVSGRSGVSFNQKHGKYVVTIGKNNKSIYLGIYSDFEEACKVREEAELEYYGFIKE